jgi:hypothetical protein
MARSGGGPVAGGGILGKAGVALDEEARANVRRQMVARNWGSRDLARITELNPTTILNLLRGKRVGGEVLRRVAYAFEEHPADELVVRLMEGGGEREPEPAQ